MAGFSDLVEDFSASTLDSGKWTVVGTAPNLTASPGELRLDNSGSGVNSSSSYVRTTNVYPMDSSVFTIKWRKTSSSNIYITLQINEGGSQNKIALYTSGSNVIAAYSESSSVYAQSSATYDPETMVYWRFRHNSSTFRYYWDYSADGETWTNLWNQATSDAPSGLGSFNDFYLSFWASGGGTNYSYIDAINVIGPPPVPEFTVEAPFITAYPLAASFEAVGFSWKDDVATGPVTITVPQIAAQSASVASVTFSFEGLPVITITPDIISALPATQLTLSKFSSFSGIKISVGLIKSKVNHLKWNNNTPPPLGKLPVGGLIESKPAWFLPVGTPSTKKISPGIISSDLAFLKWNDNDPPSIGLILPDIISAVPAWFAPTGPSSTQKISVEAIEGGYQWFKWNDNDPGTPDLSPDRTIKPGIISALAATFLRLPTPEGGTALIQVPSITSTIAANFLGVEFESFETLTGPEGKVWVSLHTLETLVALVTAQMDTTLDVPEVEESFT